MNEEPSLRKVLFLAAAGLSSAEERRIFLDGVCRGDAALRKHLETLLDLQRAADTLFDLPPEVGREDSPGGMAVEEGLGASIGRYRLIERLGEGGCGVVYLAEQQEPVRRKVALKIIRLGMDTESVIARFEGERQALAMMDHPNIARVYDAGATASGRPYFVMELVDGEPITRFCESGGLDLRDRLSLFVQVCQAIQHAHQKGVIHRDIKPTNVLVSRHEGGPLPKVIDFGIAKAAGPGESVTVTNAGHFLGTPAYMSPEQAAGSLDVDTRSDIYSLGVLLYELVAGRPAFDAKRLTESGIEETRRILREEEPPPPSTVAGGRPSDLDWIVLKAIAKERPRRYDTANGLAVDVGRYLRNEPVSACPPSRRYRLGKLVSRNKVTFAAAGIAVCGLLGGFGVSTWAFFIEKSAREEQARLRGIAEIARANEATSRENAEYRERVARAAVQIARGSLAEADRLLSTIPADRTPVSLEAAECLRRVADWHWSEGRHEVAADRFTTFVHTRTTIDDASDNSVSFHIMSAASALCYTGKDEQFVAFREFAIQRFADSKDPQVAEQLLKACLLKPADPATLRRLDPVKEFVAASVEDPNAWIAEKPYLAPWSCFALGLTCYRDGDYREATRWLYRTLSYPDSHPARETSARLILAMIDHHEGREANASLCISIMKPVVEAAIRDGKVLRDQEGSLWLDWVNAALWLDEVIALQAR